MKKKANTKAKPVELILLAKKEHRACGMFVILVVIASIESYDFIIAHAPGFAEWAQKKTGAMHRFVIWMKMKSPKRRGRQAFPVLANSVSMGV